MSGPDRRGERLLRRIEESGRISAESAEAARRHAEANGVSVQHALLELGCVRREDLVGILEEVYQVPSLDLSGYEFDPRALLAVPEDLAKRYGVMPLFRIGSNLSVALPDPLAYTVLEDLRIKTGLTVKPVLADPASIADAIERGYRGGQESAATEVVDESWGAGVETVTTPEETESPALAAALAEDDSAVALVQAILGQAVKGRASDIHLEPKPDALRVRFRVDGSMREIGRYSPDLRASVVSRIKILSQLDIAEKRRPQDGRFKVRIGDAQRDLRVSTIPTSFGEKVVLRLLGSGGRPLPLGELGFADETLAAFRKACQAPYGIVLVTGPTGSGKTTTLYSALGEIATPDLNVATLEDPVEFTFEDVAQTQVNAKVGLTFERGLESLLRQDPDVILVGEIRDAETARIAVRAAMTGHLILSTLHTNDSTEAVQRLSEMGVEPYLLSTSLLAVLAQRLLRRVCAKCAAPVPPEGQGLPGVVLMAGRGCAHCERSGYHGRVGIYELLVVDDRVRPLVTSGADAASIRAVARERGMRTLRQDAMTKVRVGTTTLAEALSMTRPDE